MKSKLIAKRFRGFYPVVVDVETGGFNPITDALLEIAFVTLAQDESGMWHPEQTFSCHVLPFQGANLSPESLAVNKIDPYPPFRFAVPEEQALREMFEPIHERLIKYKCHRAIMVGHNPWFDLSFIKEAVKRCRIKNNPFHAFTTFDT